MKVIKELYHSPDVCHEYLIKKGYFQLHNDQCEFYYNCWVNPKEKTVVEYCEGDLITNICENKKEFFERLDKQEKWFKKETDWYSKEDFKKARGIFNG